MNTYYPSDLPQCLENDSVPARDVEQPIVLAEAQALSSANLARWFDLDSDNSAAGAKGAARVRRRLPPGSDQVKHRRTRSGCYTCRSRRVKCDETHPICKRCAKGSRDCIYPEPLSATKSTSGSKLGQPRKLAHESDSSSGEYEDEDLERPMIESIGPLDGSETIQWQHTHASGFEGRVVSGKKERKLPNQAHTISSSYVQPKSLSPSTDDSGAISKSRSTSTTFTSAGMLSSGSPNAPHDGLYCSNLPPDIQYYVEYHQQHINYHHYFFKHDATYFVNTLLLEVALEYNPLLYAVVGFAAYHSTMKKTNGKVQDFLGYYNKSVQLLLKSLQGGQKHTDATLLTILQLAAIEEYLGDWVNLLSHQKAAYKMLLELYSPETITHTETGRKILIWYTRFDLFAGLMSGAAAVLSREWMAATEQFYLTLSQQDPSNLDYKMEEYTARHRLIAIDMALTFAKLPRGEISIAEFHRQNDLLAERIQSMKRQVEALHMPEYRIMSFEGAPERDSQDIVDPYTPGLLYKPPLWTVNFMHIDLCAMEALHRYQVALILQQQLPTDLEKLALEQCRLIEALEFWPGSPAGSFLLAQAGLGLICLFLPKDEKHIMWCRRKLAKVENMGYIYPPTFRTKISELWNISGLEDWWLPNEETLLPIVKSVRAFVEERTTKTTNKTTEDVKNMKAMFAKLNLTDSPQQSSESSSSLGAEPSAPLGMKPSFGPVTFGPTFPGHPEPQLHSVPASQIQAPNMWFDPIVEPVDPAWDLSDTHMGTNQQFYHPSG